MKAIIVYRNNDGEIENGIFGNICDYRESLNRITFAILHNPTTARAYTIKGENLIDFISLEVKGKTYAERKENLTNKAIEWSYAGGVAEWSYGELAEIQSFFERYGRRYGLIREFRENAII